MCEELFSRLSIGTCAHRKNVYHLKEFNRTNTMGPFIHIRRELQSRDIFLSIAWLYFYS